MAAGVTIAPQENGAKPKTTISGVLAGRIAAMRYETLPEAAVNAAKNAFLDTLGVTLAGSREEAPHIVAETLEVSGSAGACTIVGTAVRARALDAALVNGTAAHALDYDDSTNSLGGHPSVPILPALLALAEQRNASGRDTLAAYVAGFETETKIARGVNFHHFEKGWHPTATLGVFGSAAACANLMRLPADKVETALGIAASFASGVKANFGTMTKPLHVGHTAHDGLLAAQLAERGFTSAAKSFEHHHGFLEVFNGAGNYDVEKIVAAWEPMDILDPGIGVKQYPCCAGTHSPLDALFTILRSTKIDHTQVARIQSWSHKRRIPHVNNPDPRSGLEAKFSLHYCLARAIVDNAVTLEDFEGDTWSDPRVRALLPKVEVAAYDDTMFDPSNHMGAEIHLTMNDGTVHKGKVQSSVGRSAKFPLPPGMLEKKFGNCARRAIPSDQADALRDAIATLDAAPDIRAMMGLTAKRP